MQSSVVATSTGCKRNAVALKDPCVLTLNSGAPNALIQLRLLTKEKVQRLRLETKSMMLSQSSVTLGTCSLQKVAASWLRSHSCKCAWGKFHQLLPLLNNRHLPLLTRGWVYSACVRRAMKPDTLNRLRCTDCAMICWICNVKAKDKVSSDSVLSKLCIQDLDVMKWACSWIAEVCKLNVGAQKRPGWPRKTWEEVLMNDRKKLGMDSAF